MVEKIQNNFLIKKPLLNINFDIKMKELKQISYLHFSQINLII